MKKENGRDRFIQPIRYIPFDIGAPLPEAKLKQISESLERKFQRMSPNGFFGVVGNGVSLAFCLTEQIRLYLFRYGIGVFSVTDEAYWFNERDGAFAIEYCQQRKYRHKQILNFQAEYSELLQNTIGLIRTIAHSPGKPCRITASEAWEYRGLSYVMTVSCLHLEQKGFEWEQLEETVKKNLLVMLTPSLMNMEDSLRSDYKSGVPEHRNSAAGKLQRTCKLFSCSRLWIVCQLGSSHSCVGAGRDFGHGTARSARSRSSGNVDVYLLHATGFHRKKTYSLWSCRVDLL